MRCTMSADGRDGSEQVLWEQAMNDAVAKMRANIARFGDQFPKVSKDGQYVLNQNDDWTCGFWPGILWLSYEYTGERIFRDKAVEAVDECLGKVVDKILELGGTAIITADHGNSDEVVTLDGKPMTAHTTNPVPVIVTKNVCALRDGGILADLAPTLLDLLEIEKPTEMTGESLIIPEN